MINTHKSTVCLKYGKTGSLIIRCKKKSLQDKAIILATISMIKTVSAGNPRFSKMYEKAESSRTGWIMSIDTS